MQSSAGAVRRMSIIVCFVGGTILRSAAASAHHEKTHRGFLVPSRRASIFGSN